MSDSYPKISSDLQDGNAHQNDSFEDSVDSDLVEENSKLLDLFCHKSGCGHLRFHSETQYRKHILSHITLPSVIVPRLNINCTEKEKNSSFPDSKKESLKVTLKLKSQSGSRKPAFEDLLAIIQGEELRETSEHCFSDKLLLERGTNCLEVVRSTKVLSGPGGLFCLNGPEGEVKTEWLENISTHQSVWSSTGRPESEAELDESTASPTSEEREDRVEDRDQEEEEDPYRDEDDTENDLEEEEAEEGGAESTVRGGVPAPLSPTPSEVLRPQGYLAPEHLVDDDSCYPRSPPVSPARMVEINGSTSTVSGSDNDSGHSRSPAAFTGGSGAGSGGEEDSSGQQGFNWDELVGASTGHESNESSSNENGLMDGSPVQHLNDVASSEMGSSSVVSNILDNDPLLLPENASSVEGEQENMNLLQNLTSDPLQSDVDRGGETEYMSLDRLGAVSGFCCDVCVEHFQDGRMLEEHRVLAGHYKCRVPDCVQSIWSTSAELAAHQSSAHGMSQDQQSQQSPPQTSPQTPPQGGSGTPPVQQLAQQVQRLPLPQQGGYQPMVPGGQYPVPVPQQQLSPQLSSQSFPPQLGPPMPGPVPQRRSMAYRMSMPGQPFGPGAPNQQQPAFSGSIQPRPLNTLVAQQPVRGPMSNRMPPGAVMSQNPQLPRGMAPMSMRGQKRSGPIPQSHGRGVMAPKQRRVEGMMPPQQDNGPGKKSDAKAVANILATRGITVTPAGSTRPGAGQPGGQVRQRQNMLAPAPPPPVTTLNLNSAISIIPTSGSGNGRHQNNSSFAVPQVRSMQRQPMTTNVERPPRPPTVDLTGDGPPPGSTRLQMGLTYHRGRGRPSNLSRATCQICDKVFASPDMLSQHMLIHRGPGKLPFRCHLCNAQYPTQQGLQQHRQGYHKEVPGMNAPLAPGEEMVIPLVDLKQPGVAARLSSLGIHHCIPLSGLGNQSNGYFSLPVVSIDGSRPSAASNLRSLGASGVLSIGPIKLVPK